MSKQQSVSEVMAKMLDTMPKVDDSIPTAELPAPEPEEKPAPVPVPDNKPTPASEPKRGRKKTEVKETAKISADVDYKTMSKIRAISTKERVSIRDIFDTALDMYVKAYEAKHGAIRGVKPRGGSASDLL